jgi:poly(hydroxyalkanoate) depolymerase family esterase
MNNNTVQELMREATRLTQSGQLLQATAAIQKALGASNPACAPDQPPQLDALEMLSRGWPARTGSATSAPDPTVLDGCVFETSDAAPAAAHDIVTDAFISGIHTHASLTRRYKLYVPPHHAGKNLPLVVMLHGCTQDPDDFAAGTRMNRFARDQGFFVLYPAQAQDANPSRCWNWFKHTHQRKGSGEPAWLADMTLSVVREYGIDERRVYVAGLSAGGAMAAIVAGLYPDIFAAAGIHSGLASGAASNLSEALGAMKNGSRALDATVAHSPVRTIVFHGDQDSTVHARNGEQAFAAAMGSGSGTTSVEDGAASGRRYTRTVYKGEDGTVLAEHWLMHGAGHAWSGGSAAGSYADGKGPDATAQMLRFFFERH